MPADGQHIRPLGMIPCEVCNRVAVRAFVRDDASCKPASPEIRAPYMVCAWHVCPEQALQRYRAVYGIPVFPGRFANGPHRAITHSVPFSVRVIGLPCHRRSPSFCLYFPTKKGRQRAAYPTRCRQLPAILISSLCKSKQTFSYQNVRLNPPEIEKTGLSPGQDVIFSHYVAISSHACE